MSDGRYLGDCSSQRAKGSGFDAHAHIWDGEVGPSATAVSALGDLSLLREAEWPTSIRSPPFYVAQPNKHGSEGGGSEQWPMWVRVEGVVVPAEWSLAEFQRIGPFSLGVQVGVRRSIGD